MRSLVNIFVLMIIACLFLGAGCGGDDGGSSPTDPGDGGDTQDPEEFTVATVSTALDGMLDIDTLYRQVCADQGAAAAGQAALAQLEVATDVAASGISPDGTIWARFNNGLRVAILTQERSMTTETRAPVDTDKAGGEATGMAVVMMPFAHRWGSASETAVAAMLDTCFGLSTTSQTDTYSDGQVTVDRLASVLATGPGVLLYSSHGCLVPVDSARVWTALVTGESAATNAMADRLVNDYMADAIGVDTAWHVLVAVAHGAFYLAVTPAFVIAHANFDALEGLGNGCKSLVYACCCNSGRLGCELQDAFCGAGVDKYVGWSDTVGVAFASDAQRRFFRQATDTCTVVEAYQAMGTTQEPGTSTQLMLYSPLSSGPVMIRAKMPFEKDGEQQHGYSVGVAVADNFTTVSCFAGQPMQMPTSGMTVQFPSTGPGAWNCVGQDDAVILWTDFTSGQIYVVQKDFVGVDGQVEVTRYDGDIISGTFNGTLGYWTSDQDPEEDPPTSTMSIESGVIKHVGMRF